MCFCGSLTERGGRLARLSAEEETTAKTTGANKTHRKLTEHLT